MKFYVISDNFQTLTGMRLAGMEGVFVHSKDEAISAIHAAAANAEIGIILITEQLAAQFPDMIGDFKMNVKRPLLVAIPDRHGNSQIAAKMEEYINEAIGIKM